MAKTKVSKYQAVPSIVEENTLDNKQLSEKAYSHIASGMLHLAKPAMALFTVYNMASAINMIPKAVDMYEKAGLEGLGKGLPALLTGLTAYGIHRFTKSVDGRFNEILSDNVLKKIDDYQHTTKDIDKLYTRVAAKQSMRHAKDNYLNSLSSTLRAFAFGSSYFVLDHIPFVDPEHASVLKKQYAQDDSPERAFFIAHVLGELGNDKSFFAQRLKEEDIFQRDIIKAFMDNSAHFVRSMADKLPSISEVGKVLSQAIGPDARHILKNIDDYNKGKTSYLKLELDILEHATRQSQVETLHREFATRVVNVMMRAATGSITPESMSEEKEAFRQFGKLKGVLDSKDELIRLAKASEEMIDKIHTVGQSKGSSAVSSKFNQLLRHHDIIKKPIKFKSLEAGSADYHRAVDAVMHLYMGKDKDLHKTFHQQYVESAFKVVEKRVRARAYAKLSPEEMAKSTPETIQDIASKFGIKSTDSITPQGATKSVMDRVRARFYYHAYEKEVSRNFDTLSEMEKVENNKRPEEERSYTFGM